MHLYAAAWESVTTGLCTVCSVTPAVTLTLLPRHLITVPRSPRTNQQASFICGNQLDAGMTPQRRSRAEIKIRPRSGARGSSPAPHAAASQPPDRCAADASCRQKPPPLRDRLPRPRGWQPPQAAATSSFRRCQPMVDDRRSWLPCVAGGPCVVGGARGGSARRRARRASAGAWRAGSRPASSRAMQPTRPTVKTGTASGTARAPPCCWHRSFHHRAAALRQYS